MAVPDRHEEGAPADERARACATLLMELAPLVIRLMRQEMAAHADAELSVPQFRALRFVARRPGCSLSELAETLGTSLPAASKLVDRLVDMALLQRATDPRDRRQLTLALTSHGQETMRAAHNAAQDHLASRIAALSPGDLDRSVAALGALRAALATA